MFDSQFMDNVREAMDAFPQTAGKKIAVVHISAEGLTPEQYTCLKAMIAYLLGEAGMCTIGDHMGLVRNIGRMNPEYSQMEIAQYANVSVDGALVKHQYAIAENYALFITDTNTMMAHESVDTMPQQEEP